MAALFAAGSLCFVLGPFPGYANLVGDRADAVTFVVGSILFTAGGALQSIIAFPERRESAAGRTSDTEATLFKSNGIASWDLAVAIKVYKAAREKHVGHDATTPDRQ